MHIEVLRSQLDPKSSLQKPAIAASECVRRVIVGVASAVQELLPASMAAGGLQAVLKHAARRFKALTGVHVEVQGRLRERRQPNPQPLGRITASSHLGPKARKAHMTDDPRCCGSGTFIIDPEGRCWCGQQWDGQKIAH